eukprot:Rmarinus@m.20777
MKLLLRPPLPLPRRGVTVIVNILKALVLRPRRTRGTGKAQRVSRARGLPVLAALWVGMVLGSTMLVAMVVVITVLATVWEGTGLVVRTMILTRSGLQKLPTGPSSMTYPTGSGPRTAARLQ